MEAIKVLNVGMVYNLSRERVDSIKEYAVKLVRGELRYERFAALNNVSFSVEKGDVFGVVGFNGAGKSTLLKIISGIMKPTEGSVCVNGLIAPLIELGAGFDMELTARENIYLNGSVLGYSKKFLDEKFDEIVDFSEVHEFLDIPMKNYSSGMIARVAFSVATIVKPDILILDEIMSVGDYRFQQKCEQRIRELMSGGTTVLIVSHNINQIKEMCSHALWLEHGEVKTIGSACEVCEAYKTSVH
jgi:ABC-type polysaccharide/polyol phosphate transport system ATPase subunit